MALAMVVGSVRIVDAGEESDGAAEMVAPTTAQGTEASAEAILLCLV